MSDAAAVKLNNKLRELTDQIDAFLDGGQPDLQFFEAEGDY